MKKLCLLSGMIAFTTVISVNASEVRKTLGNLTKEQRAEIEKVQKEKIADQKRRARPPVYYMLDQLFTGVSRTQINWPAVFEILDSMQGVIGVNDYINLQDQTLLLDAVNGKELLVAKKLLEEYQASPNFANKDGRMPLMAACSMGDLPMVKLLLLHGANPHLKTKGGRDSFWFAKDQPAILAILDQYK